MQGVFNPNILIYHPPNCTRVCTLVLFINTCVWLLEVREVTVSHSCDFNKEGRESGKLLKLFCIIESVIDSISRDE